MGLHSARQGNRTTSISDARDGENVLQRSMTDGSAGQGFAGGWMVPDLLAPGAFGRWSRAGRVLRK
jgi:hypothetical protein